MIGVGLIGRWIEVHSRLKYYKLPTTLPVCVPGDRKHARCSVCNEVGHGNCLRCKSEFDLMRLQAPNSRSEVHASTDLFCEFDASRLWLGDGRRGGVYRP